MRIKGNFLDKLIKAFNKGDTFDRFLSKVNGPINIKRGFLPIFRTGLVRKNKERSVTKRFFFDFIRKHNRYTVTSLLGIGHYYVKGCIEAKLFRSSDFNIGDTLRTDAEALKYQHDWLGTAKERLNRLIAQDCDGIITGLYEYDACYRLHFPDKTTYIPFPIKVNNPSRSDAERGIIRLFIGINRERSAYKGTDIMLRAAQDLQAKYPDRMQLNIAESVPFNEYQQMMEGSDAILDQLYSYTPSMNSLLAMSKGIICIGGGEPENYDILHETQLRPIINVQPNYQSVYDALEQFILHPELIPDLKRQSIEYVHRHHDYIQVAKRYLDVWNKK